MTKYLFDSSALLAILFNEKGNSDAFKYLNNSAMSSVNYAEVITKLIDRKADPKLSKQQVNNLIENILPFHDDCGFIAGKLITDTAEFGLSLGDRACIATAINYKFEIITSDKVWSKLDVPVKIHVIR